MSASLYINFRMVESSDFFSKDSEGNLVYHNRLFSDDNGEEFEKFHRSMGQWKDDDLEELLEIGIYLNDSEIVAAGLEGLLNIESDTRIHKAVRRGLTSAWGDLEMPNLFPWFRMWLGESLGLIGKNRDDKALILIGKALYNLGDDEEALAWLANYLCEFRDLNDKDY